MYKPNGSGLKPSSFIKRHDPRTFNHEKQFGAIDPKTLPKNGLGRKPISIENQRNTNFCTAYGSSTAGEYILGADMSPEWSVAKISEYLGFPIFNGASPEAALHAAVLAGLLPRVHSPFDLEHDGPDTIANWRNWPKELAAIAEKHKMGSYFDVMRGSYDTFDNICIALTLARQEKEERVVLAFTQWYENWGDSKKPYKRGTGNYSLHCHLFIDYKEINGERVLVEQNSYGEDWGDHGLSYWTREAVNQLRENSVNEMYMFRAISPQNAKQNQWGLVAIIFNMLMKLNPKGATEWLKVVVDAILGKEQPAPPPPQPQPVEPPKPTLREQLYKVAKDALVPLSDVSPEDQAPDELACVESMCKILRRVEAFKNFPIMVSTIKFNEKLSLETSRFRKTTFQKPGNILIYVSGTGILKHGHVFVILEEGRLASNNSKTGNWDAIWTIEKAKDYYQTKGGMKPIVYELIG